MTQTLLRGTQIQPATVTAAQFVASLGLPTTQLADGAKLVYTDGTRAMTAALNLGGFVPTNAGTPVAASDVANKAYVDALKNGFQLHFAHVVAVANVALTGIQTIDGYAVPAGNIVLLTGQTTTSQNGLWTVASGAWTRPAEWASGAALPEGQYIIIDADGSGYANTKWFCTVAGTLTVDTTAATFSRDQSGTTYSAGTGLTLIGTVFAAKLGNGTTLDGSSAITLTPDPSRLLQVVAAGVGIKDGTAGQLVAANASGNAAYLTVSGDATLSGTGALTLSGMVAKYANCIVNEIPTGTVNGSNTAFTLANTPQAGLQIFLNGNLLFPGTGNDYTIAGAALTMLFAPATGDRLVADYFK